MDLTDALRIISKIENHRTEGPAFIETRFPYTYAYDYMRGHAEYFPGLEQMRDDGFMPSRGDCAAYLRDNPEKAWICFYLANAYLREHNTKKPNGWHWEPSEKDFTVLEQLLDQAKEA